MFEAVPRAIRRGEPVVWRDDLASRERLARSALGAPTPFDVVELHG